MMISNEAWTWSRAARAAHELSLSNKDKTFYAAQKPTGDYCVTDNPMVAAAAEDGSAHRNGERVCMPYESDPANDE